MLALYMEHKPWMMVQCFALHEEERKAMMKKHGDM